ARRRALLAAVPLGVSLLTFITSHAIQSDPARLLRGQRASDEEVEPIRLTHALDLPLPVQYVRHVSGILKGDLGRSIRTGRPVAEDLARFFPATLELVVTALTLAVVVGVPLGVWSASRQNTWVDHISRGVSVAGVS